MSKNKNLHIVLKNRDELWLQYSEEEGYSYRWIGCTQFETEVKKFMTNLLDKGIEKVATPSGSDHSAILLRELLYKIKDQWDFPYTDEELCHCRKIPTFEVDQAVIAGTHDLKGIGIECSAGITCGSCQPDIEKIIAFRLKET